MNSETQAGRGRKIGWICDWTVDELLGGAELTGRELLTAGQALGYDVKEITPRSQQSEIDWIIINNVRYFPLITISQMLTSKFIYFCHDPIILPIHQHLFSLAKHIFFYSPAQINYYTQFFPINLDKVSLCPAPIDPDKFYSLEKEDFAVSLSDLGANKGIYNIMQIAKENPSLRIELYGKNVIDYKSTPELSNLQYKGVIPYSEVPKILALAKIFIHCPVWLECFGRSVVEAYLSDCQLTVNQNVGAFSYSWNWQDKAEIKERLRKVPTDFWLQVGKIIESSK
jgi:glycosyltransferase involved in cell wall biosynthesis